MKNKTKYLNYFLSHYRMTYSEKDIETYRRWFTSQWKDIQRYARVTKKDSVLELGSGIGSFYSFLPNDIDYIGLELDSSAVKFANSYFSRSIFQCIPIERFITKKKFKYIFAFEVLEHLDDPVKVIQKIRSLLKKDGLFIGTSPYPYPKNIWGDSTHKYVLHPQNWKKIMEESGFHSVLLSPMTYLPYVWRIHPLLNIRFPFYIGARFFVSTCLFIAKA